MTDVYEDFDYQPNKEKGGSDVYQDFGYVPQQKQANQSLWQNFKDYEKGGALGFAQKAGDIGASLFNLPGELYKYFGIEPPISLPHPSLQKYYPKSGPGQIGSKLGGINAALLGTGGAALKGASMAANPLLKILTGAFSTGAEEAATNEGDRIKSGLIGAASGAIPGIASTVATPFSKKIASNLLRDKDAIKNAYNQKYTALFDKAAKKGVTHVPSPEINMNKIENSGMPRHYKALEEYIAEPTLENAHWAQSGLGGLERKLEKIAEGQGLTPPQTKAYNEVKRAKKEIQEAMFSNNKLGAQPKLAKEYQKISEGYASDVVPWKSARGLEDFRRGELKASDLTNKLRANKKFMAQLGSAYPSLKINAIARSPITKVVIGSGLGIEGLMKAYDMLK